MKRWKDPFPTTPQGFHERVEQALGGLEENDMKHNRNYRKLTVALAAALIALLAVGAVALVVGNNKLKEELSGAGAADIAGRVQDVHLTDAGDGFDLCVDEVIWEDQDLYISYTLSVPEDGNTYLVGLMEPRINGEPADYRQGLYFDNSFGADVMAMGGDYPATRSFVQPILADSRELALKDMKLGVRAAFFRTDRPLEYVPDFFDEDGMYERSEALVLWKGGIIQQKVFPSADALYYWYEDDGVPQINLSFYRPVLEAMTAEDAEAKGHVAVTYDSTGYPGKVLTPAGLDSTGIASLAAERKLELPLDKDMVSHDLYNDLAEHTFRFDGMTVTVENFRMTHFSIKADILMVPDEGISERDEDVDFSRFPTMCVCVNGEPLLGSAWGGVVTAADGSPAYREECGYDGYVPLGSLKKVELVARHWDEAAQDFADAIVVAELTPLLDDSAAEAERNAVAMREAAGSWQPGDADMTVYATQKGTYYHLDPECSGMRNAREWRISDAVSADKKPCPVCAGGKPAPAEWEEGEDISNFSD